MGVIASCGLWTPLKTIKNFSYIENWGCRYPTHRKEYYCGPKMYQVGTEYLKEQPFYVCYQEWMTLRGICEGGTSPSYSVRVIFNARGIANSCCTCYTNRVVPCKHIAALLVLWTEHRAQVPNRVQWAVELKATKKEELVALLEKIVDLYPDSFLGCDPCLIRS